MNSGTFLVLLIVVSAAALLCLWFLVRQRIGHVLDRDTSWAYLMGRTPWHAAKFDPVPVEALPSPARRFFTKAFEPNQTLQPIAQLKLTEAIGGRRNVWHQMLAFPHGSMRRLTSSGALPVTVTLGIEGERMFIRRWFLWLIPVPMPAVSREQLFDRMMIDAALWTPAALLPGPNVSWSALDDSHATVRFADGGIDRTIELEVDPDGMLVGVRAETLSARVTMNADFEGSRVPSVVALDEAGRLSTLTLERLRFIGPWTGPSHS